VSVFKKYLLEHEPEQLILSGSIDSNLCMAQKLALREEIKAGDKIEILIYCYYHGGN